MEVTAPDLLGLITTSWQMVRNGEAFSDVLTVNVEIVEPSAVIHADPNVIDLTLSPNPSAQDIRIDWSGPRADQILLFNQVGQQVASFFIVPSGQELSLLAESGVYYLVLEMDGYRYVQKVVRL